MADDFDNVAAVPQANPVRDVRQLRKIVITLNEEVLAVDAVEAVEAVEAVAVEA